MHKRNSTAGAGGLASKQQIMALSTPKFIKAVEDAKMIHGEVHISVARALNDLGEQHLNVCSVEDLIEAKEVLEKSMKIQVELAGGKLVRVCMFGQKAILLKSL